MWKKGKENKIIDWCHQCMNLWKAMAIKNKILKYKQQNNDRCLWNKEQTKFKYIKLDLLVLLVK